MYFPWHLLIGRGHRLRSVPAHLRCPKPGAEARARIERDEKIVALCLDPLAPESVHWDGGCEVTVTIFGSMRYTVRAHGPYRFIANVEPLEAD